MSILTYLLTALWPLHSAALPSQASAVPSIPHNSLSRATNETTIFWSNCTGLKTKLNLECANITVPLDWDRRSSHENITLALARIPCTEPASRVGTLVFNPGGPGEGAIGSLGVFSDNIKKYFDLVAMDPRGTGRSDKFKCPRRQFFCPKGFPQTETEYEALANVARDLEAVRIALGEGKLNFVGFSYGAQLAVTYAELFPTNFRAMMIDGVSDNTVSQLETSMRHVNGYREGFERFATWCDSSLACMLHGRHVHKILDQALVKAGDDANCLSDNLAMWIIEGWWGALAERLAIAAGEDDIVARYSSRLMATFSDLPKRPSYTYNYTELSPPCESHVQSERARMAHIAVHCLDAPLTSPSLSDFTQQQRIIDASNSSLKDFGADKELAATCIGWPFPPRNPSHRLNFSVEIPPILVVNSLHDYRTPYAGAVNIQNQLPSSVLLTTKVNSHCSYDYEGSPATSVMEEYMINGKLPVPGTVLDT
ncbi:hypothetical protein M409DRAFT_20015 [Zasmidium cellare ATCC 36951]|uniref:Uncharacterized protein n=1 Tax=Zasmidium cellare ATCC 36951 TaxID=1080233 RepID=A0A6A6CUV0_ZASCE|nr:uncharacterized protein M409DRAFT_20015 [Zasmidium cellare ATCC 36951]KAF2169602.1 hypothetical protein M409DRAFT_20015 [Zasmidium cellare ATCC 36951]